MNESYLEVCWGVDLLRHRGTWDLGVVGSVGLGCILASQDGSHRERCENTVVDLLQFLAVDRVK